VGPCTVGLASVAGIILGIVGLLKIKSNPATMKGHGLAIAGIVVSGLGILILPLLGMLIAILLPAVFGALDLANSTSSANNVKQLCSVTMQYAASHRQKLPPVDTWPEVLPLPPQVMADPSDQAAGRAYAMNAGLAGKTIAVFDSSRTVLFFECRPGSPPAGGPDLLPDKPRHAGKYVIGFLDGHVEAVPPENVENLVWEPKPGP
jgi:prepilin-type processing-associated H-X9-DG protein